MKQKEMLCRQDYDKKKETVIKQLLNKYEIKNGLADTNMQ